MPQTATQWTNLRSTNSSCKLMFSDSLSYTPSVYEPVGRYIHSKMDEQYQHFIIHFLPCVYVCRYTCVGMCRLLDLSPLCLLKQPLLLNLELIFTMDQLASQLHGFLCLLPKHSNDRQAAMPSQLLSECQGQSALQPIIIFKKNNFS